MPELLLVLGAGLLIALAVGSYQLISTTSTRRRDRQLAAATWQPAHRSTGDRTLVVIQKTVPKMSGPQAVLDERPIGELADTDPDWEAHLAELIGRARTRAAALNA